jgi:hypothetical protein
MSSHISTYTGVDVDLLNIQEKDINIYDIAHSTSMIVRFNGHIKFFYSVGQHCILVSEVLKNNNYSIKMQLYGLLHDASEAYFQDIITPIKHSGLVDIYREKEEQVSNIILQKFEINLPGDDEKKIIKNVDKFMFINESKILRNITIENSGVSFEFNGEIIEEPFLDVENKYVNIFSNLMKLYKKNE